MDTNMNMQPEGSKGSLIGSIIVVLILVIGAIYLYMNRTTTPTAPTAPAETTTTAPAPATTGPDDTQSMQNDAKAVDTASLDASVNTLGSDFQQ